MYCDYKLEDGGPIRNLLYRGPNVAVEMLAVYLRSAMERQVRHDDKAVLRACPLNSTPKLYLRRFADSLEVIAACPDCSSAVVARRLIDFP